MIIIMEFDEVVNQRRSIRNFKEAKKPPLGKVMKAIESASKSPLAGNLPALKYILVTDKGKIQELAQAAQQSFISKVSYIIVVCSDKKFLEEYFADRADSYAKQQAGAAIENFLLKVTDMDLASCWIGAFSTETVKRILKIPEPRGQRLQNMTRYQSIEKGCESGLIFLYSDKGVFACGYRAQET